MAQVVLDYIKDFEKMGFGMFVHFGLYSIVGKGEWSEGLVKIYNGKVDSEKLNSRPNVNLKVLLSNKEKYEKLTEKFNPSKTWAKDIVKVAKSAGCKYITLTTRHHEGFSLFDTKGLTDFDAMHAKCKRDLVKEFVDACREGGIVPFFYHTLLDWHNEDYDKDFNKYLKYLRDSVEILCKNYGKIGGFWFDGWWDKKEADWQFDELYKLIRKYQPKAMIINNTGMSARGRVSHYEIDSITFERGKPVQADNSDKYRAGEMCQVLNDHWGYAKYDCNYKPLSEIISNLVDCRVNNCNFLLNAGPMPNGKVSEIDRGMFAKIGLWIKANKNFIYKARKADITVEGADVLFDGDYYYAVINDVPMSADENVQITDEEKRIVKINANVKSVKWLDTGKSQKCRKNAFEVKPFTYGNSLAVRVARFEIEK
ncbi:MAG: alpha-L-fucosidase [Clostridia bacterium]|nr:alpha-L-fucosidase [Clostridia bacterium]